MKHTFIINGEWVTSLLDLLEDQYMTLNDIQERLREIGIEISIGEIRTILSAFYLLGILDRYKTRQKAYKYKIKTPEIP